MSELTFTVVGARMEPYAAVPTLVFRLGVSEATGERIHTIALRIQVLIEPQRRGHSENQQEALLELFGEPYRWGDTVRPLTWFQASAMVPGFTGSTELDLPVTCTYDFEVSAAKYLDAVGEGEIPLRFLFSGTLFARAESGFRVEQVPWEKEAVFRLPAQLWRQVMDRYFPGSAWIRLSRDHFDALVRFKGRRGLPSWDAAVAALLEGAGEEGVA